MLLKWLLRPRVKGFWATVCKTVRSMLSDRCLSCLSLCLSVMLVYCSQTVGWIDAIWYGDRPRPRPHCVRWGPALPHEKGHNRPPLSVHFALSRSPISATAELLSSCSTITIAGE